MARDLFHSFTIEPGKAHEINAEFVALTCLDASAELFLEFGAGHKIPMTKGAEWLSENGPISDRVRITHKQADAVSGQLFVGLNRYVPPAGGGSVSVDNWPAQQNVTVDNFPEVQEVSIDQPVGVSFDQPIDVNVVGTVPAQTPVTPLGGTIRTAVLTSLVPETLTLLLAAENVNGAIIRWMSIAALVGNIKSIDMNIGGQQIGLEGGMPFTILNLLIPAGVPITVNANLSGFNLSLQSQVSVGFDLL